jgi:hypothetical protein
MDMWNWLLDCYKEGSLTRADLDLAMKDDRAARTMWEDWSRDSYDFIEYVRSEIFPFLVYLDNRAKDKLKSNGHD